MQRAEITDVALLPVLSFSALEEKISIHLPESSDAQENRQGFFAAIGMLVSWAGIKGLNTFIPVKVPNWYVFILTSVALLCMLWLLYTTIRREIPNIRDRRRISATELDQYSGGYKEIAVWLQTFPIEVLEEKLDFVQKRIETIELRSSALFGNVDRFGLLAVLVALYLHFKDATISWPPDISLSSLFLTTGILGLYFASVWATSYKWQLHTYRQLIQMAMKPRLN